MKGSQCRLNYIIILTIINVVSIRNLILKLSKRFIPSLRNVCIRIGSMLIWRLVAKLLSMHLQINHKLINENLLAVVNIYWLTVISIPVIWYQCTYTDSILERPWHAVQLQYVTVSNSGNKILITSSWGGVNYLPRSFLAEVDVFVFVSSLSEVSLPLSLKNSTESWHRTFLVRITVFNFFLF